MTQAVAAGQGYIEFIGYSRRGKYQLWCRDCFDRSDNSGVEDRCCGDRAYEDTCAAACGY
jgi:hypothetical protein